MLRDRIREGGEQITNERVPKLHETENTPIEKKKIYRRYVYEPISFYWLIAEMDRSSNLGFGYANLNDDPMAEWGYIDLGEVLDQSGMLDRL